MTANGAGDPGTVDVDDLFRTTNIDTIKNLKVKLSRDIDRKREDLRMLVGERYRDLMEAADTIVSMKNTVAEVEQLTLDVVDASKLVQVKVRGQRAPVKENDPEFNFEENELSLAAQVKLLVDCSEVLWTAVDQEDFLKAAVVFLFARHIHTNLTLNSAGNGDNGEAVNYPIVGRRWDAILPFKNAIVDGCKKAMEGEDEEVAVRCMASLILLNGPDLKSLFMDFISTREKHLKKKMEMDGKSAKSRIKTFLVSVMGCVRISKRGFLDQELKEILDEIKRVPVLQLFHWSSTSMNIMNHLPAIVSGFSPSVVSAIGTVEQSVIRSETTNWMDRVHEFVVGANILSHVNSVSDLTFIRQSVIDSLSGPEEQVKWKELCLEVLGREVSLWEEFFRNVFRDRVEGIVTSAMQKTYRKLAAEMEPNEGAKEDPISNYIWTEETEDFNLGFKSKGFSVKVQSLCGELNAEFGELSRELDSYIDTDDPDAEAVLEFSQKTLESETAIEIGKIRKKWVKFCPNILNAISLCRAVQELCPEMRKLAEKGREWKLKRALPYDILSGKSDGFEWNAMVKIFRDMAHDLHLIHVKHLLGCTVEKIELKNDDVSALKFLLPQWEVNEISETNENGENVVSSIAVPCHISPALNGVLRGFTDKLYESGIHATNYDAVPSLVQKSVIGSYSNFVGRTSKIVQNVALQLHFDVQFVAQFVTAFEDDVRRLLNDLEKHIDPFDMNVFCPYITANVKKAILRHQTSLACLIAAERHALLISMKSGGGPAPSSAQHNAMRISEANIRFPLLPIQNVAARNSTVRRAESLLSDSLVKTAKTAGKSPKMERKRDRSPVARAAGSFFEAMSTSWFGGK